MNRGARRKKTVEYDYYRYNKEKEFRVLSSMYKLRKQDKLCNLLKELNISCVPAD